jgi:hypothetical protein
MGMTAIESFIASGIHKSERLHPDKKEKQKMKTKKTV